MNAYELADRLEEFYKGTHIQKAAETLRLQADEIEHLRSLLKPDDDFDIDGRC